MTGALIAFIGGIIVAQYIAWVLLIACIILLAIAIIIILHYRYQILQSTTIIAVLSSFCFGMVWMQINQNHWLYWQIPNHLIAKNIKVTGTIISIPKKTNIASEFVFATNHLAQQIIHTKLLLKWYGKHPLLRAGDSWNFTVRVKPPHGLSNPGGFNYERYLRMRGITAKGYVVGKKPFQQLNLPVWRYAITSLRQKLQRNIQSAIANHNTAAIISALAIGSRSLMTKTLWQVFQNTGTSHLIAISGLHIGLVAIACFGLFSLLWRCSTRGLLMIAAPQVGAIAALTMAWLYGLLAGFSLSTQRAVIMITALMVAQLYHHPIPVWRRLLYAFAVIVLCQPLALYSASFWLSFSAVACIGYGVSSYRKQKKHWLQWIRVQWVVCLGLMPITLWYFQQWSLVMLIANSIAIPWISFCIVPLSLLGSLISFISVPAGQWLFYLAGKCLWPLLWWLIWLAHLPGVIWHHSIVNSWVLFTSIIGAAILMLPKGMPGRWLGLIWLLPLFYYRPASPKPQHLWVTVLDVGQGLSVVVRTATHTLLYDAGPKSFGGFDAGRSVILPFLKKQGINRLAMLVISHGHNDHIGGAPFLLQHIPIKRILTSVPKKLSQLNRKQQKPFSKAIVPILKNIQHCWQGQHWHWDGVQFRMLFPPPGQTYLGNNSSCVLQIRDGSHTILLTGDIERSAESWLVQHYHHALRADVLVVPHHGSNTSSTTVFLQQVKPHYAIFSLGYYNRFHFPSSKVVARYRFLHTILFSTAQQGAITIKVTPNNSLIIKKNRSNL